MTSKKLRFCMPDRINLFITGDGPCRTLPIGLTGVIGNIGSLQTPIAFVAHGISVPVFRGSPPIPLE